MNRTLPLACCCWLLLSDTGVAYAQAVPVDEIDAEPPPAPAPSPPPPEPPQPPKLVRPKALSTEVTYPEAASGDAEVVLELVIGKDGTVEQARAIEGTAPFTTFAEQTALGWRFEPATRDGQPMSAKIRFQVRFTEPQAPVEAEPEPAQPEKPQPGSPPPKPEKRIEVVVYGERKPLRQRLTQAEVRELPGAFGDPYRAIEALPGVVPIMSGIPYFYVRGAPPGNVGYFFDGIPVPMLYHFAAGPGVLHPAFVDGVDLYAGAYPVRYGRFAGGIVAGDMAAPEYRWRGEASIRIIDSGGMIEAPFADGRGSIMLGGRYSYTGLVISLVAPDVFVHYWDYQGRARYAVDDDDSVEVFCFGSGDLVTYDENPDETVTVVDVMFHRIDLRWDHDIRGGRWRNAVFLGLDDTAAGDGDIRFLDRMVGARTELDRRLQPGLRLRAGADVLFERLSQALVTEETTQAEPSPGPDAPPPEEEVERSGPDFGLDQARSDLVIGGYTDFVIDAGSGIEIVPGLRTDLFASGHDVALGVDPRITARFQVTDRVALVHGLGLAHQAPSFVIPIPGLKPSLEGGLQTAVQHSAGVETELPAGFFGSLMFFNNIFFNMTDLLGLAQLRQTDRDDDEEDRNFRMLGRAYGAELMIRRSLTRDLGGFVAYTLSRSERFRGRLEGPSTTDRTHVLNLALSYNLGRNWRLGNRWLLYSGIPARVAYIEAAKNPPRTPAFWRLDWRLQKRWPSADGKGYWGFIAEVLNTTLNKEVLSRSCNAYTCDDEAIGPVTIPSLGVEAGF